MKRTLLRNPYEKRQGAFGIREDEKVMYLHVGNNYNIRTREIIGVFDADTATVSAITKKYLSEADARGAVIFASEEIPKSFVLYRKRDGSYHICFSQLSSSSLIGRMGREEGNEKTKAAHS